MKAMSVKAKRFATTIVVMAICFIIAVPVHAAYSLRTVTIKVFQDQSYLDTYSYDPDYIETTMRRVAYPFKNKWNISLKPSYYNVWGMPLEDCPNGYYAGCDNSNCGSTCVNKFQTKNHHNNFNYNTLFARRSYDYVDFDLALVVSGANLCHINDEGIHSTGCLGWTTSIGGDFMMVKQNEDRGDIQNVRVTSSPVNGILSASSSFSFKILAISDINQLLTAFGFFDFSVALSNISE